MGEVSNQEARCAGAVIICCVRSHSSPRHAVFAEGNRCQHTLFRKRPVPVVVIQLIRLCVIRKKEIRPTIVVVIKDRNT